jgi:intraflagellar transport protein 172 homolog
MDLKTIAIMDLVSGMQLCTWSTDEKINWLELNETGKKLLFRDRLLKLYLLDIPSQESELLLNYCGFVQWVPNSDVLVAQSKDKLYIWYDLTKPVVHELIENPKAEAISIERDGNVSKVLFNGNAPDFILNEILLEFDTALESGDLRR